jgi:hypothetical protein
MPLKACTQTKDKAQPTQISTKEIDEKNEFI